MVRGVCCQMSSIHWTCRTLGVTAEKTSNQIGGLLNFFFFSVCVLFPIYFGVFSVPPSPFSPGTSCPLLPVPAEFFHPAISATQTGPEKVSCAHNLPKISLQGSWASLRSPSVNCSLLHQVRSPACFCLKMLISTSHPKREA